MIERATSKSQKPCLKFSGRYVCSSVDPENEARLWVEKNAMKIKDHRCAIILGVGCGYHLIELHKKFPGLRVLAIDFRREFVDFVKAEHIFSIVDATLLALSDLKDAIESPAVRKAVQQNYVILKFNPAIVHHQSEYEQLEKLLLAREDAGFRFVVEQREEFKKILNAMETWAPPKGLISIKTLDAIIRPSDEVRSTLIIKALRELVN